MSKHIVFISKSKESENQYLGPGRTIVDDPNHAQQFDSRYQAHEQKIDYARALAQETGTSIMRAKGPLGIERARVTAESPSIGTEIYDLNIEGTPF